MEVSFVWGPWMAKIIGLAGRAACALRHRIVRRTRGCWGWTAGGGVGEDYDAAGGGAGTAGGRGVCRGAAGTGADGEECGWDGAVPGAAGGRGDRGKGGGGRGGWARTA